MRLQSLTVWFLGSTILILSCGTDPVNGRKARSQEASDQVLNVNDNKEEGYYASKINLTTGSRYTYSIANESVTEVEVNGKTVNTLHKSDVAITYDVQKDSVGNYLLSMHFNKIHQYSKSGENETEFDADNAAATMEPTEKMMGYLKDAAVTATISPVGKVLAIVGYKELGEKMMTELHTDVNSRNTIKAQWEKIVGDVMIKKSIEQLFTVLPDKDLKAGDTWQKSLQQKAEIEMSVISTYTLKEIENGIATIESEGKITSDKKDATIMGYLVSADLQGEQEGEYKVEASTGMVLKNETTSTMKGVFGMLGKQIPAKIKNIVVLNGNRVR